MKKIDVLSGIKKRKRHAQIITIILVCVAVAMMLISLVYGRKIYSLSTVFDVLSGKTISGASFVIGELRLPRMLAGVFVGFGLGLAGSIFQKMLRNTLASPDIIGISSSTSMAAVFCILMLHINGPIVSIAATIVGLVVAVLIYILASVGKFATSRFILIGIGVQAITNAVISYMMVRANQYEVSGALRWISGSLDDVQMSNIPLLALSILTFTTAILLLERYLNIFELGDDIAVVLGVRVKVIRSLLIGFSVLLIAFATSVGGPIAFVSFLSGPIAVRLVGSGRSYAFAAGIVGIILVLSADLVGQYMFEFSYPVGVITGVIGAPFLVFMLIQMNKKRGGS